MLDFEKEIEFVIFRIRSISYAVHLQMQVVTLFFAKVGVWDRSTPNLFEMKGNNIWQQ